MAADRPFKSFFAARDALDAEILAGKLKLKGTKHVVFRIILEHTLYQAKDINGERTPEDDGFVVDKFPGTEITTGVEGFALVSCASPAAVKDALKSLEHDDKLITRFTRPLVAGGRKTDRIRVNWALPEEPDSGPSGWVVAAPEEPDSGPSEEPDSGPSEEPESGSSIQRKQELIQEQRQRTSSQADDGHDVCPSGEDRGGDPHTPRDPGHASSAPGSPACDADLGAASRDAGEAVEPDWTGDGENARDNRLLLAEGLGVGLGTIGAPLWRWLEDLGMDSTTADLRALLAAAQRAKTADNPVGYFQAILPGYLADAGAKHDAKVQRQAQEAEAQAEEAAAQAARERAERELWESTEAERAKILATMPDFVPGRVRPRARAYVQSWLSGPNSTQVSVWHHPEFDVVFSGGYSKCPGPDWKAGYLNHADWGRIRDQDVIPLSQAA